MAQVPAATSATAVPQFPSEDFDPKNWETPPDELSVELVSRLQTEGAAASAMQVDDISTRPNTLQRRVLGMLMQEFLNIAAAADSAQPSVIARLPSLIDTRMRAYIEHTTLHFYRQLFMALQATQSSTYRPVIAYIVQTMRGAPVTTTIEWQWKPAQSAGAWSGTLANPGDLVNLKSTVIATFQANILKKAKEIKQATGNETVQALRESAAGAASSLVKVISIINAAWKDATGEPVVSMSLENATLDQAIKELNTNYAPWDVFMRAARKALNNIEAQQWSLRVVAEKPESPSKLPTTPKDVQEEFGKTKKDLDEAEKEAKELVTELGRHVGSRVPSSLPAMTRVRNEIRYLDELLFKPVPSRVLGQAPRSSTAPALILTLTRLQALVIPPPPPPPLSLPPATLESVANTFANTTQQLEAWFKEDAKNIKIQKEDLLSLYTTLSGVKKKDAPEQLFEAIRGLVGPGGAIKEGILPRLLSVDLQLATLAKSDGAIVTTTLTALVFRLGDRATKLVEQDASRNADQATTLSKLNVLANELGGRAISPYTDTGRTLQRLASLVLSPVKQEEAAAVEQGSRKRRQEQEEAPSIVRKLNDAQTKLGRLIASPAATAAAASSSSSSSSSSSVSVSVTVTVDNLTNLRDLATRLDQQADELTRKLEDTLAQLNECKANLSVALQSQQAQLAQPRPQSALQRLFGDENYAATSPDSVGAIASRWYITAREIRKAASTRKKPAEEREEGEEPEVRKESKRARPSSVEKEQEQEQEQDLPVTTLSNPPSPPAVD
jgi:hypothetical protein